MTNIEWVKNPDGTKGETWNPVTGCTKISPGCKNCYAERMARRLAGRFGYPEAPDHFKVTLHHDKLNAPLRRKKPTRYFVCSMGDLFHEDVPYLFASEVLMRIASTPQHTYMILTKRPGRMLDYFNSLRLRTAATKPMSNVWLGVTAENQATADERIPILLQTPAAVRFVSCEPLLGEIDFDGALWWRRQWETVGNFSTEVDRVAIDWIIVGGETGHGARPMQVEWARDLRDQCKGAGVPFFFKSWGEWFPRSQWEHNPDLVLPDDGDCAEVRNLQIVGDDIVHRVGKKAAGRSLDGQLWEEDPA